MKKHLNTLYVTTQGAYLAADGETAAVKVDGEVKLRAPLHLLEGIVCFGRVSVSPALMGRAAERGLGISYLTQRGRFLARVNGPVSGNVLLRREQYRLADDDDAASDIARSCVVAKIANCRTVLLRAARDHSSEPGANELRRAARSLATNLGDLGSALPLNAVRGVEGDAARSYFAVFDHLVVSQKVVFRFSGRRRRPPTDPINALMSFTYTLLTHDVASALEAVGLDPQVGFLHRDRPGRPGLALDVMEEFRPYFADRLVLSLVNRRQVRGSGFETTDTGGVAMNEKTRRTLLVAYQERKNEEVRHPFLGEKTTVGMLPHLQALLLARFIRGDLDAYPPFIPK